MNKLRCPGQDQQNWKPEDISDITCPHCHHKMEIWKDEPVLPCPHCKKPVKNPSLDLGCAEWCKHGDECRESNNH